MKTLRLDRLDKIFPNAYFAFYTGIAEPGYDDTPLIVADWNNTTHDLFDNIEALGYECGWCDEWLSCSDCGKAVKTSPDSYCWQPSYAIFNDCELVCLDCLDAEEYFESIENDSKHAVTTTIARRYDPADYGYKLVGDEYESGLHRHQTDDPAKILAAAQANDPNGRYLFVMTGQGQFDVHFALYRMVINDRSDYTCNARGIHKQARSQ